MPVPTARELKKGYWLEPRATVSCLVHPDGQLVVFDLAEVEAKMDQVYPHALIGKEKVWYFNSTKDREIAEQDGPRVVANPRALWDHFMK